VIALLFLESLERDRRHYDDESAQEHGALADVYLDGQRLRRFDVNAELSRYSHLLGLQCP